MSESKVTLCGASAYEQKYYFNPAFDRLPQAVKDELQILCVTYTEEIGGVLTLWFDDEGELHFTTEAMEADGLYDDIGSVLKIKEIRSSRRELLQELQLYYQVAVLHKQVDWNA